MKASRALRLARNRAGLSQRELAARTGVAQPSIARIESGRVIPRVDTLDRLLGGCGEMLEAIPRLGIGVDRTLIDRLLKVSPAERVAMAVREANAIRRMTGADIRSVIGTSGVVALRIDDLTVDDLPGITWSGNPAHIRSVAEKLQAVARLEADYLAVRAPDGSPIAKCLIDYSLPDAEAEVAQLAVRPDLQGLGIGSHLLAAAERRIHERGRRWSVIGVDLADSRPRALYERLGYEFVRHEQDCWEVEDEAGQVSTYHADVVLLRKRVGP